MVHVQRRSWSKQSRLNTIGSTKEQELKLIGDKVIKM